MAKRTKTRPRALTAREKEQIETARRGPAAADIVAGRKSKADCDLVRDDLNAIMGELKTRREAAGKSLADLEGETGISKGALSRLENGLGNPTLSTVQRIAEALDCDVLVTLRPHAA